MCSFTCPVGPACFQDLLLVALQLPALLRFPSFPDVPILCLRRAGFGLCVLVSCANTAGLERTALCSLSAIWFPREAKDNDRGMLL